jgi:hypothetical protein
MLVSLIARNTKHFVKRRKHTDIQRFCSRGNNNHTTAHHDNEVMIGGRLLKSTLRVIALHRRLVLT